MKVIFFCRHGQTQSPAMAKYQSFCDWLSRLTVLRDEREKDLYCDREFYLPAKIQIFPPSSKTKAQCYSGQPCM